MIILNLEEQRFLPQATWLHCFKKLDGMEKMLLLPSCPELSLSLSVFFVLCYQDSTEIKYSTFPRFFSF